MLLFVLCGVLVFGLPLAMAASARLVVTGASEFRARVLESIAAAVRRGVPVDAQFVWLIAHDVRGRRRSAVCRAARNLDAGNSLAYALSGPLRLPPEAVAAIAAADGTPHLDATLRAAASADRRRWRFRHQLLIRLAYPALVLSVLGGFLGLGVAPKFHDVLASMDADVSPVLDVFATARVVGFSLAALTALVALSSLGVLRRPLHALDGLRRTARTDRAASWLGALATAVRCGRPLDEALDRTAEALGSSRHAFRVHDAAEHLRDGATVEAAWSRLPLAAWLRRRGVLLAGPTDELARALAELADDAAQRAQAARDRLLLIASPLLLLLAGAIVGGVFLTLFQTLQRIREAALW